MQGFIKGRVIYKATTTGTNTYAVSIPGVTAYDNLEPFLIQYINANTGPSTLNVNAIAAKSLTKSVTTPVASGDILANQIYWCVYDGTNLQVIGIGSGGGGGTWGSITGTLSAQTDLQSALDLKSPLAGPTFTGTVTTPAIIVSAETASRVAIIDATKNVKSADTVTYPSLTELALVKGVTSAIQTQFTGKVATTGNETVAGIKTFSSFPVTPSSAPTTDYQTANKKYVDDTAQIGSKLFLYYNFY